MSTISDAQPIVKATRQQISNFDLSSSGRFFVIDTCLSVDHHIGMLTDATTAEVSELPKCSWCPDKAKFDFRTYSGVWGYGCTLHWIIKRATPNLGMGNGHRLVVRGKKG